MFRLRYFVRKESSWSAALEVVESQRAPVRDAVRVFLMQRHTRKVASGNLAGHYQEGAVP